MNKEKDTLMILSSLLYLIPAAIYYKIGDMIGASLFTFVTFTSVMGDGVYVGNKFYSLLDRFFAPLCYIYACVNILIYAVNYNRHFLLGVVAIIMLPFIFFYKSKKLQLLYPNTLSYRYWHISWHISCATALSFVLIYFYL